MPHKRKGSACLNCGQALSPEDNFCRNCGQENDNRYVSFIDLTLDYIEENIGIDSKLIRSLKPFFFNPGKLTQLFINGQRRQYVPPLRIYIVMSVFYFLALSLNTAKLKGDEPVQILSPPVYKESDLRRQDSIEFAASIAKRIRELDSILPILIKKGDTAAIGQTKRKLAKAKTAEFKFRPTVTFNFTESFTFEIKRSLLLNPDVHDTTLIDSLGWEKTWLTKRFIRQVRKLNATDDGLLLAESMIENASTAIFLMVPFLALFMKLIYLRRNQLYIGHLVHLLHIQGFIFFIGGLYILAKYLFEPVVHSKSVSFGNTSANQFIEAFWYVVLISSVVYVWRSFKVVYQQHWFKTTIKLLLSVIAYGAVVFALLTVITAVSFLTFD